MKIISLWVALFVLPSLFTRLLAQEEKLRVLVLTDIEADPDDAQSLVRFLTYANQWDIEGLIATTSIHQKTWAAVESIHAILDAYAEVQPKLLRHEPGYPSAEELRGKTKQGSERYGRQGVGPGQDSPGSDWIIQRLEQPDPRPIWFCVWGGPNTLAQALWKIQQTKPRQEARRLFDKVRIYTISDQDDSGPWIRQTFPTIFYIVSPGYNYPYATWLGMAAALPGSNPEVVSKQWLATNIQQGHSVLGTMYPDVAYGMEGDTPTFLGLIPNGLNVPERPDFGGWGGRYELKVPVFKDSNVGRFHRDNWPKDEAETRPIWTNADDSIVSPLDGQSYTGNKETIWRWRTDYQNDFAARMDWTVKDYAAANHPPVPLFQHPQAVTIKAGTTFFLDARGSTDPDGDSVSYEWFQYREAGTYPTAISFRPYANNMHRVPFTAPAVTTPQTIHFILRLTDKGSPPLSRYKRLIVTVVP